jgi:DNA-binding NarL/FixJ family response regulator
MTKRIRVLIAEDHPSVRERLAHIVSKHDDFQVVATVGSGAEAVERASETKPDIALMDIEMETIDAGIAASRRIHRTLPEVKIIVLTIHKDESTVLAAFQAGIVDYLTKDTAEQNLAEAIRLAHRDRSPMRPIVANMLRAELENFHHREEQLLFTIELIATLTQSELEILRDVVAGKPRKQIARERFIELVTVKKHINSIHRKFGTSSTAKIVHRIRSLRIFDVLDTMLS